MEPNLEYESTTGGKPDGRFFWRKRPSIFMPRWACRLLLEVVSVRVERVQEISVEDCIAEGLSSTLREHDACCDLKDKFRALWDKINGKRGYGWDVNPYIWRVEFKMVPDCTRN